VITLLFNLDSHSSPSVFFPLLPKFLMDYDAGWGNRTNREGTAPAVLNIHPWGQGRFLERVKKLALPISALRIFNNLHG